MAIEGRTDRFRNILPGEASTCRRIARVENDRRDFIYR